MTRPLRSRRITRRSSLLRAVPPLCLASVLKPSWDLHLGVSLGIEATGSKVPCKSLSRTHAVFVPEVALSVGRHRQCSSRGNHHSPVSTPTYNFDTSSTVRFRSSFRFVPDAIESRLFRVRSPRRLLTVAAPRWFAVWSCNPTARGQLSSLAQLRLAHGDRHICS
jgi:hypothetical protein